MNILKRISAVLLCCLLLIGTTPANVLERLPLWWSGLTFSASAEDTSGICGDNLTWQYDADTFTLTISGTGEMYDYSRSGSLTTAPWKLYYQTMKSVLINNGITSIGSNAFYGCTDITSITIPNSVTNIAGCAFSDCTELMSITIPDSVTSIGAYAFSSCTGLTSIVILGSVSKIEEYAFCFCTGLTSITLPDSVTSIGNCAFRGCTRLTSITIPNSVTSIDSYAFEDCTGLTSITIPDSVTSIGSYSFNGCTGLASITIPDSVMEIGSFAFFDTAWFNDTNNWQNDTLYIGNHFIAANTAFAGSYTIKAGTKSIGGGAFRGCTGLTSITIPNGVTCVGDKAFYGCSGLTSIIVPSSVSSIEEYAFCRCTALTSITIPDNVSSIGKYAFYGCTGLTSATIPNSVTQINAYTFDGCTKLMNITIPNSVTSIDNYAFYYCPELTNIIIPSSVLRIGEYAFCSCTGLTSITIPNSVTNLGDYAFFGCAGLKSISISNSLSNIGTYTFCNCIGLANVIIPNSITSIGDTAFANCKGLASITIPNSVTSIGGSAFSGCTGLTSITIPNHVTSIGRDAFRGCTNLTSIFVPESVQVIGDNAFLGCDKLTAYVYPNSPAAQYCETNNINYFNSSVLYNFFKVSSGAVVERTVTYNGHTYIRFDESMNWEDAKTACELMGGYLATITSAEEQSRITTLVTAGSKISYWIGATDAQQEGAWKWVNGEAFSYTNWNSGEPNNNGTNGAEEDFAVVYSAAANASSGAGTWNDENKTSSTGFVCEIDNTATLPNMNPIYRTTFGGHIYAMYDVALSWDSAKEYCESTGGHLATITNSDEWTAVLSLVLSGERPNYWLGATDKEQEGIWKWVTGEPFTYTCWNSGEPNNAHGYEHYIETIGNPGWNDVDIGSSSSTRGFICEFEDTFIPVKSTYYNGHFYSVYNETLSWTQAEAKCESMGGHLVTITDSDEQNIVSNLVQGQYNALYLIGCTDSEIEGEWRWVTGEPFTYSNWGPNEPNATSDDEDYGEMYSRVRTTKSVGHWNDVPNMTFGETNYYSQANTGFVCEVDANEIVPHQSMFCGSNEYVYYDYPLSWIDADLFAKQRGGHLITITSAEEQRFLEYFCQELSLDKVWIGASFDEQTDSWRWVTGENWKYSKRNSSALVDSLNRKYYLSVSNNTTGLQWVDEQNVMQSGSRNGFIIEYDNRRLAVIYKPVGGSGLSTEEELCGVGLDSNNPVLPALPRLSKANRQFLGWFSSEYGGEQVPSGLCISDTQSLYARWATDFSISSTPRKLSYYVGDTLDTTGLALRAVCDNGETLEISNDFICTPQVFTKAGPQTVTVSYGDASAYFTVNVVEPQSDGLSVWTLPTKTSYFVGDTLDLTGLELLVHQNNNTEYVITNGYECVTPALLQTPGQRSVTVRYNNLYTSFDVSVEEVVATGLTIASPANKTAYYTGDTLLTDGLSLRVAYNNGTTDDVTSGFICSPKTLSRAGSQTITVTYEGLTVTYDVTVVQKQLTSLSTTKMPKQLVYYVGDTLNTKGLQLQCAYNNGDTKIITDISAVTFTYDFSTLGQKTVTVSYTENGKTVQKTFSVTVLEKPEIYTENISADAGEEFAVPVYIRGNNGIAGFKISLQYDASVLTPLRVDAGSILGMNGEGSTNTFSDNAAGNTSGKVDVMWAGANNMTDNGMLFTVYFTTDASIGGGYPITVSYSERDTFDEGFNPVKMVCADALVTLDNSAYTSSPRIKADSVTVQKDEQVRVPIRLLHSNGINSVMVLNIIYPTEAFSYVSLENGTANVLNATSTASGVQIILMDAPAATNSVLFTLVLDVSKKAGGDYTVTPVDSTNSIQTESGVVSVQTLPVRLFAADQTIWAETTTISVPVKIENNRGIMGLGVQITYDPVCLRLTGITRGEVLTSGSFLTNTTEPGQVVVLYSDSSETTANGTVFNLEFQVLSALTSHTQITLEYDQENTFNEAWDDVALECNGATVYKVVSGDADEDGEITLQDVVVITRWLAGGWNVTINETNSDVNRDGEINLKDAVLIRRFLAGGWNVVLR